MPGAGRDRIRPPRAAHPSAGRHPGLVATLFPPGPGTGSGGRPHRQRGVTLLYLYRNEQGRGAAAALFYFFYMMRKGGYVDRGQVFLTRSHFIIPEKVIKIV